MDATGREAPGEQPEGHPPAERQLGRLVHRPHLSLAQ